jgi:hypothetical protein
MNESQTIRIDAVAPDGQLAFGAVCVVTNVHGSAEARSGASFQLRRAASPADVVCRHEKYETGSGRLVSRAGAMWGNIVAGGVIGAIVDHQSGKGYNYPSWIQIALGQSRLYDRDDQIRSEPMAGREIKNADKSDR